MKNKREHVAVWFEIPAANFDRAARFYETVLGTELRKETMCEAKIAVFKYGPGLVSGNIIENPKEAGGNKGVVVYLNADGFLNDAIKRVEKAGGKLAGPVVKLPGDMGSYINIEDTEGNKVGLHDVSL